jgi:asparagine synthetase B (glutamine-hydrolysing)
MDLPTIDGINTYFVSEQTRAAGVKVALSGLGGDEMFAGYSSFRTVPRMERLANAWAHLPLAFRSSTAHGFAALTPSSDQNRKLSALGRGDGGIVHPYFLSRMLFTPEQLDELLPAMKTNSSSYLHAEKGLTESLRRAESLDPDAMLHAEHAAARFRFYEYGSRTRSAPPADRP